TAATGDRQFARMDRSRRSQFARVKMKCIHPDQAQVQIDIRFKKLLDGLRRDIATTRQGNMWMPWTQVRFEPGCECSFLHSFMNLKEMRMTFPYAEPNNLGRSFWRKCSNTDKGQKECAEFDRAQPFTQHQFDAFGHVAKKAD